MKNSRFLLGAFVLLFGLSACSTAPVQKRPTSISLSPQGIVFTPQTHTEKASCLLFTPDGRQVISGSDDGSLILWDLEEEIGIASFPLHRGKVRALAYDQKSGLLYSLGAADGIRVTDLVRFRPLEVYDAFAGSAKILELTPDNKTLIVAGYADGVAYALDPLSGKIKTLYQGLDPNIESLVTTTDGFFAPTAEGEIAFWSLKDKETPPRIVLSKEDLPDRENIFAVDGEQKRLALLQKGSDGLMIQIRSMLLGHTLISWPIRKDRREICSLSFSPDGKYIIALGNSSIRRWDAANGEMVDYHMLPDDENRVVALRPDGESVLSGSRLLELRHFVTGTVFKRLPAVGRGGAIPLGPDWTRAITPWKSGQEKGVYIWNFAFDDSGTGNEQIGYRILGIDLWVLSKNGDFMLASSPLGLYLYNTGTGAIFSDITRPFRDSIKEVSGGKRPGPITALALTPNGRFAAIGTEDGSIFIWDVIFEEKVAVHQDQKGPIKEIHYSPNGSFLLSVGGLGGTWLREGSNGRFLRHLIGVRPGSVALSHDNMRVLTREGDLVVLRETYSWEGIASFEGTAFVFLPDKKTALLALDKALTFIDINSGEILRSIAVPYAGISELTVRSDGRYVILRPSAADKMSQVWDLSLGKHVVNIGAFIDGSWLAVTPDGRFTTTSPGRQALYVYDPVERRVTSSNRHFKDLYDPDYVGGILAELFGYSDLARRPN